MNNNISDLLIIGGGPAGLCAAISGSSEGLKIKLLDNGYQLGGQAVSSSAIENYPGFPGGVTGDQLMGCFVKQASDFETEFVSPANVAGISRDTKSGLITVITDDYREFVSKAVLISIGLQYRILNASGIGPLMGRGIYYGAPVHMLDHDKPRRIAVVGGANSAGQAVAKLATTNPQNNIKLIIRGTIEDKMSTYLINRIRNECSNVEICEGCEVTDVVGRDKLESIWVKDKDNNKESYDMDAMFIFIGAMPRTLWLQNVIQLDNERYILTGNDVIGSDARLPFETSMPGVFAAGDVRSGSTKRVAVASGEGANALQNIHRYLATFSVIDNKR